MSPCRFPNEPPQPIGAAPNLERIKERLWALRWLAGAGANLPGDQVCVRGQERRTLAWLIGTDLPDLIAEVERLRPPGQPETRQADVEPPRCWVPSFPDGTPAVAWPDASTPHWPDARTARDRIDQINPTGPVVPRQLDHPCVIISCGACLDTFDGNSTVHFDDLEEAHTAISESTDWNRWTILPDGNYLCPTCNPEVRPAIVEAVASDA